MTSTLTPPVGTHDRGTDNGDKCSSNFGKDTHG